MKTKKIIENWSDKDCLDLVIKLLENRVGVTTGFVPDEDTGILTHQILYISCGDLHTMSQPQPLAVPLRSANAEELVEQGISVN